MMKGFAKCIVLLIVLALILPVVSAYTVSSVSIDPSGDLLPGTAVTVSYKLDFAASGGETFPSEDSLQMITDLEKPKWTWTLLLNGVENPRPQAGGRMLELSGWDLSYPSKNVEESIRVTLEGTTPAVTATTNKTMIKIQEMDSRNAVVSGTLVEYTRLIINTGEVSTAVATANNNLAAFRAHIDEKYAMGIDTSAAESQYNTAKTKIDAAQALPSTQFSTALSYLNAATSAITSGEKALDEAWAQYEVTNAQVPIDNTDKLIAYFMGNQSTANDAKLVLIKTKREAAASALTSAQNNIANGNYMQARVQAADAYIKGNESFNDALTWQKQVESGWNPFGGLSGIGSFFSSSILVIIVGVVAVVLVVVGVIIYRKRSRWDELG
jgi:hypothetical protein